MAGEAAGGEAAPTVVTAGVASAATGFAAAAGSATGAAACCAGAAVCGVVAVPAGDGCAVWVAAFGAGRRAVFGTGFGGRGT